MPPRHPKRKKGLLADVESLVVGVTKRIRAAEREDDKKLLKRLAKAAKPRPRKRTAK